MKDSITRQLLRRAALDHGFKVSEPGDDEFFLEVTNESGQFVDFRGTLSSKSSVTGYVIARRKDLTFAHFEKLGINVPPYELYDTDKCNAFLAEHKPIVVKPVDASQSKGVTVGVQTKSELEQAVKEARNFSRNGSVLLQAQLEGKLYRLFVLNGKLIAAAERRAPEVVGDGVSTVRELIVLLNQDPRRSDDSDTPLKRVSIREAEKYLGKGKLESVPDNSETVRVSALDSISAGGEAIDVTDMVHPSHQAIAERATVKTGLFLCGIDIITDDISAPADNAYWPLLELNSGPGLKLHHFPTGGGQSRDVAGLIMDQLFA